MESKDLFDLNSLLCQSIIMEFDIVLRQLLNSNLYLVIKNLLIDPQNLKDRNALMDEYVNYLQNSLLQPHAFQLWLQAKQFKKEFGSFDGFIFFESACFDDIAGDYWRILYEPVQSHEIEKFQLKKLKSCIEILTIIAGETGLEQYIS